MDEGPAHLRLVLACGRVAGGTVPIRRAIVCSGVQGRGRTPRFKRQPTRRHPGGRGATGALPHRSRRRPATGRKPRPTGLFRAGRRSSPLVAKAPKNQDGSFFYPAYMGPSGLARAGPQGDQEGRLGRGARAPRRVVPIGRAQEADPSARRSLTDPAAVMVRSGS